MTRTITAGMVTASQDATVRPVFFGEFDFISGFLRINTSPYALSFDSGSGVESFGGVGELGMISAIEEGSEARNFPMKVQIRAIPSEHISRALTENYQGRDAKVWLGLLDDDHQLIADPMLAYSGLMDTMEMAIGRESSVVLTLQSRFVRWETPADTRYTNEEQQRRFPADKGLEFVDQMVELEIAWGSASGAGFSGPK